MLLCCSSRVFWKLVQPKHYQPVYHPTGKLQYFTVALCLQKFLSMNILTLLDNLWILQRSAILFSVAGSTLLRLLLNNICPWVVATLWGHSNKNIYLSKTWPVLNLHFHLGSIFYIYTCISNTYVYVHTYTHTHTNIWVTLRKTLLFFKF